MDGYCNINVGSLDSSRDLQSICVKKFVNRLHLVLHACIQIVNVMFFVKIFWHLNMANLLLSIVADISRFKKNRDKKSLHYRVLCVANSASSRATLLRSLLARTILHSRSLTLAAKYLFDGAVKPRSEPLVLEYDDHRIAVSFNYCPLLLAA